MKKYNASSEGFWPCCDVILRKSIHHFSNCSPRFAGGYMSFDRFRIETCHLCSAFDVAKSHQSPETLFFHVSQWDEIFLFHFHGLAFLRDILACHKVVSSVLNAGGYMSFDRFRIETCHLCSAFDVAKSHQI